MAQQESSILQLGIHRQTGCLVNKLNCGCQSSSPALPYQGMGFKRLQAGHQAFSYLGHVIQKAVLQLLKHLTGRNAGYGVITGAAGQSVKFLLVRSLPHQQSGNVLAIAQGFAQQQHIRLQPFLLIAVHPPGTAHAALDLVHNDEHAFLPGPVLQTPEIPLWGKCNIRPLERLNDHRRRLAGGGRAIDPPAQLQAGAATGLPLQLERAVRTLGIGQIHHSRSQRAITHLASGQSGKRGAQICPAMDTVPESQNLWPSGPLLGQTNGPLHGLGAGRCKMGSSKLSIGSSVQPAQQLCFCGRQSVFGSSELRKRLLHGLLKCSVILAQNNTHLIEVHHAAAISRPVARTFSSGQLRLLLTVPQGRQEIKVSFKICHRKSPPHIPLLTQPAAVLSFPDTLTEYPPASRECRYPGRCRFHPPWLPGSSGLSPWSPGCCCR